MRFEICSCLSSTLAIILTGLDSSAARSGLVCDGGAKNGLSLICSVFCVPCWGERVSSALSKFKMPNFSK